MRNANPELVSSIKKRTLELLMEKEPEEIGMREIAKKCGVSATAIYHYYRDKDCLFQAISLDCLNQINSVIEAAAENAASLKEKVLAAIRAFRNWSLKNPRVASLVMEKIKSAVIMASLMTPMFSASEMSLWKKAFMLAALPSPSIPVRTAPIYLKSGWKTLESRFIPCI